MGSQSKQVATSQSMDQGATESAEVTPEQRPGAAGLQDTVGNAALASRLLGDVTPSQDETPGVIETQVEIPPIMGSKWSQSYEGEKALAGANARWEGTPDIVARAEKKGEKWHVVLDKLDMSFKYWINSGTVWNEIKDFPGGAYDASFNLKPGSTEHELAEIKGVGALWDTVEASVREGVKKEFDSKATAETNYNTVLAAAAAVFKTKQTAISDHSNPLGPNAEWALYKQMYAEYKKTAPAAGGDAAAAG